jgi:hypothetical protein
VQIGEIEATRKIVQEMRDAPFQEKSTTEGVAAFTRLVDREHFAVGLRKAGLSD